MEASRFSAPVSSSCWRLSPASPRRRRIPEGSTRRAFRTTATRRHTRKTRPSDLGRVLGRVFTKVLTRRISRFLRQALQISGSLVTPNPGHCICGESWSFPNAAPTGDVSHHAVVNPSVVGLTGVTELGAELFQADEAAVAGCRPPELPAIPGSTGDTGRSR